MEGLERQLEGLTKELNKLQTEEIKLESKEALEDVIKKFLNSKDKKEDFDEDAAVVDFLDSLSSLCLRQQHDEYFKIFEFSNSKHEFTPQELELLYKDKKNRKLLIDLTNKEHLLSKRVKRLLSSNRQLMKDLEELKKQTHKVEKIRAQGKVPEDLKQLRARVSKKEENIQVMRHIIIQYCNRLNLKEHPTAMDSIIELEACFRSVKIE